VEASVGEFLQQHIQEGGRREDILIHTKFVPDLDCLPAVDEAYVRAVVTRSCNRLGVSCLDLVQFHWCGGVGGKAGCLYSVVYGVWFVVAGNDLNLP
jgi:aryl-alcohol dehydrogenase-like predicted oxidoreductase